MAIDVSASRFDRLQRMSDGLKADFLEHYSLLPIEQAGGELIVGFWTENPDSRAVSDLSRAFRMPVRLERIPDQHGKRTARRLYGALTTARDLVDQLSADTIVASTEATIDDLVALANEAPVIQLVNLLIVEALDARASDVHIECRANGMQVRYRIDGVMQPAPSPPSALQAPIVSRLKIMAELDIAERRVPQDGRIRLRMQDREVDVRVSTLPSLHGEDVVLRMLDQSRNRLRLSDLGMLPGMLTQFEELIGRPHGLILVTGPTGSGKTTTLYAAVDQLNDGDTKIVTVEDPVEYAVDGVTQVHVNSRIGLTFATALRAFLRQDPDVMLVGEIRDSETAEIATHAALTGHVVLSTLHTNDAISAVTRLIDLGVPAYLVASTLDGIVAQRLVRTLCAKCTSSAVLTSQEELALRGLMQAGESVCRPVGCVECRYTGYRGRTGLYELVSLNDDLRRSILSSDGGTGLRRAHADYNIPTLLDDGVRLVRQGVTSVNELLRVANA